MRAGGDASGKVGRGFVEMRTDDDALAGLSYRVLRKRRQIEAPTGRS